MWVQGSLDVRSVMGRKIQLSPAAGPRLLMYLLFLPPFSQQLHRVGFANEKEASNIRRVG